MALANFPNVNKCTSQKIQIYTVDQKNSNADFCGMNVASPLNANQISMASNSSHLKVILPRNFFPTQNLIIPPFQNHWNSKTFSQLHSVPLILEKINLHYVLWFFNCFNVHTTTYKYHSLQRHSQESKHINLEVHVSL